MTKQEFRRICRRKLFYLDGAMGTELIKAGMPAGAPPELWCAEHPEAVLSVHRAYLEAGCEIFYTPTFGGNPLKLANYHLEERCEELNERLALLSRTACPGSIILGDVSPSGLLVEPFGPLGFEEAVKNYRRQIHGLVSGGVDGIVIETMQSLQEARAAVLAAQEEAPDLPVLVSLTVEADGRTMMGDDAAAALITLQNMDICAFGCNCSAGPLEMIPLIEKLRTLSRIPLLAKPNAGMPKLDASGRTVYELDPLSFAEAAKGLYQAGASLIGGCCGTTPAHLASLCRVLGERPAPEISPDAGLGFVAGRRQYRLIAPDAPFAVIGERINPTGKAALKAELREGKFDLVKQFAREQEAAGANLLDVNLGLGGIDETAMLRQAVAEVIRTTDLPLVIDTVNPEAAEAALRLYPGRALFNSISGESAKLRDILPVVLRYGAMPILLPLDDNGVPATAEERSRVLSVLLELVRENGIVKEDCVVDLLVMGAATDIQSPREILSFLQECSDHGLATVCGLSNVSFGLPARPLINSAFLGMLLGRGLTAAIANPGAPDITDFARAADALRTSSGLNNFISLYKDKSVVASTVVAVQAAEKPVENSGSVNPLFDSVLKGDETAMTISLEEELTKRPAPEIVNEVLIPAISEVGKKFASHEFYLPELMRSAEVMQSAMQLLEPKLLTAKSDNSDAPCIVVATVEGDYHDIGKNIFVLLLKNYGFKVVDLGKNVPAKVIIDAVKENNAVLVGLSALMTTTMSKMQEVIQALRSNQINVPVLAGGAAVDETFAKSIGAAYAPDAVGQVKLAAQLAGL